MKSKKIIVSVTNDLVTDQRVHKTCSTLWGMGFNVLLIGRRLKQSPSVDIREYNYHRMKLFFTKGAFFYAEFNIRLFFFLLFSRFDILTSNDLDTLPANFLVSKLKNKPLVYDSHEYFTEVPELVNRPRTQKVWKIIEQWIFPKLKDVFTVNDSIADLFEKDYGIRPRVVRNIPLSATITNELTRSELGLPEDKFILILQGSGINVQRGAEEMVMAMKYISDAILLFVGGGDVIESLNTISKNNNLTEKVIFIPRQEYNILMQYTVNSDLGLTIDKDTNLNYRFSLPNKLFDYIRAGIPVLASNLVEIKKIIDKYDIGTFIPSHDPKLIAEKIKEVISNPELIGRWKTNLSIASAELTWETESEKIREVYNNYLWNFELISRNELDIVKWDNCVFCSTNSSHYAMSWHLDIVSPGWKGVVYGDYEAVMPIPFKYKFGIPVILQPFLTQKLGVFSLKRISNELSNKFYRTLRKPYPVLYNINLFNNPIDSFPSKLKLLPNFELKLNNKYSMIRNSFSKNTKRNILKSEEGNLKLTSVQPNNDLLDFYFANLRFGYSDYEKELFPKVVNESFVRKEGLLFKCINDKDSTIAVAFFIIHKNRITFLGSSSSEEGYKRFAVFCIFNTLIETYSGSDYILDFEGSQTEGVARFYKGFGGEKIEYGSIYNTSFKLYIDIKKYLN